MNRMDIAWQAFVLEWLEPNQPEDREGQRRRLQPSWIHQNGSAVAQFTDYRLRAGRNLLGWRRCFKNRHVHLHYAFITWYIVIICFCLQWQNASVLTEKIAEWFTPTLNTRLAWPTTARGSFGPTGKSMQSIQFFIFTLNLKQLARFDQVPYATAQAIKSLIILYTS